jgi:hypothetical protein
MYPRTDTKMPTPPSNYANNDFNYRYSQSDNRKYYTSNEERMPDFQKFIHRYES